VQIEIARHLSPAHAALMNRRPNRLNLEFPTEHPSRHTRLQFHETPKLGVHEIGSSSGGILESRSTAERSAALLE